MRAVLPTAESPSNTILMFFLFDMVLVYRLIVEVGIGNFIVNQMDSLYIRIDRTFFI
jgi:hypothetical protein